MQYANELKTAYWFSPQWFFVFFVSGAIILLLIGLPVNLMLGISASSDQVFALEALISGIFADQLIRRVFNRIIIIAPKLHIPFLYVFIIICIYIFLFSPFE